MTIRINQTPVEFTLEHEKTLADLTLSLRSWAESQNVAVVGILADGKALGPDDATPLASLGVVDVEAVPASEHDAARASVVSQYFDLVAQAWTDANTELVSELKREYQGVRSALFPLMAPLASRIDAALQVLDQPWSPASATAARLVADEAEARRFELRQPRQALAQTLENLEACLDTLTEVGVLFQKGQDKDAFSRILGLFLLVEEGERRAGLQPGPNSAWEDFLAEFQPFLKEAEEALAAADFILLTDLLEYEVTPRLRTLKTLFPTLSKLDPAPDLL
jgi:hypothetical protein